MAFVQMISSLPPDGVNLNINVSFYPGITIIAQYDNLNQVFTVVASGLVIQAQFVLEWELI